MAARRPARRRRFAGVAPIPAGVDVIIPVHNARAATLECLASVLASRTERIIVVDDGSEATLAGELDALAAGGRITLLRHRHARGFPAAANAGLSLARAARRDAVLLNSDTLVPPGWLLALRETAHSAPDIGTVTPLSNRGGIVSYPDPEAPMPDRAATSAMARLARRANGRGVVDIPVGVGFCLYIRSDCLRDTGRFRAALFAQGYGEENDFCLRARARGWRHVAATGAFVAHRGGQSMGGAAAALRARNAAILERLHPGYAAMIERHLVADPLAPARRRIDALRWRADRRPGRGGVLVVTHDQGGGVERALAGRIGASAAIVLRPARLADGRAAARVERWGASESYPNLLFAIPEALPALARLLRAERLAAVELHHALDHAPEILELPKRLGVPHEMHVHDYAWLCPRIALLGAHGRYCGEPDLGGCDACVAMAGSLLDENIDAGPLRARSAGIFADARRVVAPSADCAARLARHFPAVRASVVPHEDDRALPSFSPQPNRAGRALVAVIGAIGIAKGSAVLLDCARDAARRRLGLEFVVVGHTVIDAALMATGRVAITGPFLADEATALIRAQAADIALIPSVVPETWCFALSEAWRAGLRAVVFDLGAQAERVRASGRGTVLPTGATAPEINDVLLAACGIPRHEEPPRAQKEQVRDARFRRDRSPTRDREKSARTGCGAGGGA